jgi:pyruvyl transferase EpsO
MGMVVEGRDRFASWDDNALSSDRIGPLRARLVETFRPLIDSGLPVALVDFPASRNSGDHLIWAGEKALIAALGLRLAYECSAATYDGSTMRRAIGGGTILMHGGGNFGDFYNAYHAFRLRVLEEFPDNPVVVLPQTVMFFSDRELRETARRFARHGNATIVARDVLSLHALERSFGDAARVILAPDMSFMLGAMRRSCTPNFAVVWISRTDLEASYGADLAAAAKLPALRQVTADMGAFDDGLGGTVTTEVCGRQLLVSDWYRMQVPSEDAAARYEALGFDQRSRFWVERALRLVSAGHVVVTDRLHGHILCTLAGIPHVLINNTYGKNFSYYETWSRPSQLCHLAATPAHAWSLANMLLEQTDIRAHAPPAYAGGVPSPAAAANG